MTKAVYWKVCCNSYQPISVLLGLAVIRWNKIAEWAFYKTVPMCRVGVKKRIAEWCFTSRLLLSTRYRPIHKKNEQQAI